MSYAIFPTTAEHVIAAVDAVLLMSNQCDEQFLARFLDIPVDSAKNALEMAAQLGFIKRDSVTGIYIIDNPIAQYVVTGNDREKAVILRIFLEHYMPYRTFKARLIITGLADAAAEQIRVLYNLSAHRDTIKTTITSLGTYAQSLTTEGAGLYKVAESLESSDYYLILDEIVGNRESCYAIVRRRLGEASDWVDRNDTLEQLTNAWLRLSNAATDARGPILYAANAFESFLVKVAGHFSVNIESATGINAKADILSRNRHLTKKHLYTAKYLGHIRNACDHGIDQDIGQAWDILPETSHEYVHVAISCIKSIYESIINGCYII